MSANNNAGASAGVGFWPLLFIVFLTLKLCGVIDWSWWWITAPLWAPLAILAVVAIAGLAVCGALLLLAHFSERKS
jgi:hypothetical protein